MVIAALLLLFALHVSLFPFATLVSDSGRDLANAWAIAHGGPYPAYGPELFETWKLGPVWFWWLALPLTLGGGVAGAALFVGAISAAKIPLAFVVGARLRDQQLGLLLAAFAAWPGWNGVSAMLVLHTAVVEAAAFATLLFALRAWQRRSAADSILAALSLALALHAHPTTLITAPAVAAGAMRAVWVPSPSGRRRWWLLPACALVFAVPFLPALRAEMLAGWPQLGGSRGYLAASDFTQRLARLPSVLWALLAGDAAFGRDVLLASVPWAGKADVGLRFLAMAGAAVGVLAALLKRDLLPSGAALAWLAAVAFIVVLRDATPVWMTYAQAPLLALVLATGWHSLRIPGSVFVLVVVAAALQAGTLADRIATAHAGQKLLPGAAIVDIVQSTRPVPPASPWLSGFAHAELARWLCEGEPAALHGELAVAFDFSQGVAVARACEDAIAPPRLGGATATRHAAGIPLATLQSPGFAQLELAPERNAFGYGLFTPGTALHPTEGRLIEPDPTYRLERHRRINAGGSQNIELAVGCPPEAVLVVTNLMPMLNPMTVALESEGATVEAAATQFASWYFRCDGAPLKLRIDTPDPASADVFWIGG